MQQNPNTYGLTATEKLKSKIPGTVEHKITHPTTGAGHLATGHNHTGMMSGHTNMGHQPVVGHDHAGMMPGHTHMGHQPVVGHNHTGMMPGHTHMGHQPVVGAPMNGMGTHTGLAQATVGPTVPGAIGTHHPYGAGVGHHGMGMGHTHGAVGSTAGMSTTQKIASKIPGTTEYKLTH